MMESSNEEAIIEYNIPQYMWHLVQAKINVNVWGRATGKTTGPISGFTLNNALTMPRSHNIDVGPTYEKLMTQMLPSLIRGWEKFGYKEDKHFFVRKFPPKKYNLPRAYICPMKADHYISWWNGSGYSLVSLDKTSTMGNGLDADSLVVDEAKLCDRNKLKEVLLTIRGNQHHFGHLSNHHSLMLATDMPTNSNGKWLLDYEDQMDKKLIETIIQTNVHLIFLQEKLKNKRLSETYIHKITKEIGKYSRYLNELRKNAVYVSYASTLDNIAALGIDPIKGFKRMLSDFEFNVSVLNKKILKIEDGFYPSLDENIHGYESSNHGYIDSLDYRKPPEKDCRWDADIQYTAPIDIAFDHNNKINSLIYGQLCDREYRYLGSMFVLKPEFIKELVIKFCTYHKYHIAKVVNYYYDNTSVGGNARGDAAFKDDVIGEFRSQGWTVNAIYLGQATQHYTRYRAWIAWLSGSNNRLPKFRYNRTNAHSWQLSCSLAGALQGTDGFKKDKKPENDPKIEPQEATHLSEAGDTLMTGVLSKLLNHATVELDIIIR